MVPTTGDVCTYTGGGTQDFNLQVSDKWGSSGKKAKLQALLEDGLDAALLGVLTTGSGAGEAASSIKVGNLTAKLGPPSGAATSAIDKLGIKIGGQTEDLAISDALKATGLSWRPWAGQAAGLAALPIHADLPTLQIAKTVDLSRQGYLSDGADAAVAAARLTVLKVKPVATEVAELAAQLAGTETAAPLLTVLLASGVTPAASEVGGAAKKAADRVAEALWAALAGAPSAVVDDAVKQMASASSLGLSRSPGLAGSALREALGTPSNSNITHRGQTTLISPFRRRGRAARRRSCSRRRRPSRDAARFVSLPRATRGCQISDGRRLQKSRALGVDGTNFLTAPVGSATLVTAVLGN